MKTKIDNSKNSAFETVKRSVYAFQVLIVGIAIPVLFALGISNDTIRNTVPVEKVNVISSEAQSAPATVTTLTVTKI